MQARGYYEDSERLLAQMDSEGMDQIDLSIMRDIYSTKTTRQGNSTDGETQNLLYGTAPSHGGLS